ncbi:DUF6010 family protein [Neobacillus vireti]|uniref:Uncharacterized protein n=1 Tax=Neobacillus vireti LMG 21834 TaxID=1131730 RepID=A0AB94IJQ1_9BACI|nr:DUF6010 family protein [Neobacillus vireti]ETI67250.1 hypothetical protein BAVI_18727 [Neobacillus vireti LMG 21834]KLT17936.1 hypothetical protein AA980_12750 [Neobacillus vireti]
MKSNVRNIVAGVLLALLTIRTFITFTSPISYQLFALFLAYTACVYLGAALSDSRITWISIEFAVSFIFLNCALLGLLYSPIWIGLGFILHGIWDMLHHPKIIKTSVVKWFPPICAVFDFIVAVFIVRFY